MIIRINEVGRDSLFRINMILAGVPKGVWKATHSALKRAGEMAKTKVGRFAAEEYTISKGSFMQNVHQKTHISGNSGGVEELRISFAGTVLPLLTFNTKFTRNGLVQTQVKRNSVAATLDHAFVANIYGSTSVFERVGTSRFPVEQKYGPSTAHMMQNEQVVEKMDETVRTAFESRVEHEILRVLNGWGGSA